MTLRRLETQMFHIHCQLSALEEKNSARFLASSSPNAPNDFLIHSQQIFNQREHLQLLSSLLKYSPVVAENLESSLTIFQKLILDSETRFRQLKCNLYQVQFSDFCKRTISANTSFPLITLNIFIESGLHLSFQVEPTAKLETIMRSFRIRSQEPIVYFLWNHQPIFDHQTSNDVQLKNGDDIQAIVFSVPQGVLNPSGLNLNGKGFLFFQTFKPATKLLTLKVLSLGTFEDIPSDKVQFFGLLPIPNGIKCLFSLFKEDWESEIKYVMNSEESSVLLKFSIQSIRTQEVTSIVESPADVASRRENKRKFPICNKCFNEAWRKLAGNNEFTPRSTRESVTIFGLRCIYVAQYAISWYLANENT